jgi:negative regulator of flagellin synthesis FlgM
MTMEINGTSSIHGSHGIHATHRIRPAEPQTSVDHLYGADQIDISQEAEFLSQVHDLPDVRADRVDQIRVQLAEGTYETRDKLEIAVGRLLDELVG